MQDDQVFLDLPYRHDLVVDSTAAHLLGVLYIDQITNAFIGSFSGSKRKYLEQRGIQAVMILPLLNQGRPWNFVGFDYKDDEVTQRLFTEKERSILRSGSFIMGSTTLRREMRENLTQAETLAHYDPLTKVENRRVEALCCVQALLSLFYFGQTTKAACSSCGLIIGYF